MVYLILISVMYFINQNEAALDNRLLDIWIGSRDVLSNAPVYLLQIIGIILIAFQAIRLNKTTNQIRLFDQTNFLTAFALITVYLFFGHWIILNEVLLANVFILLALIRIFRIYGKEHALLDSFDIGFLIGLASLFFAPALWFLPACFLGINTVKRIKLKEFVLVVLGSLTPAFLAFTVLFWFDKANDFFLNHYQFALIKDVPGLMEETAFTVKIVTLGLLILLGGMLILVRRMQKVNRFRKTFQVVFAFLLFACISLFFVPDPEIKHWSILVIPFSLYVAFLFNEFSKRWISEVIHFVMLFVILFFQIHRFLNPL